MKTSKVKSASIENNEDKDFFPRKFVPHKLNVLSFTLVAPAITELSGFNLDCLEPVTSVGLLSLF